MRKRQAIKLTNQIKIQDRANNLFDMVIELKEKVDKLLDENRQL